MRKNVFVLGAGFSVRAGFPLVCNLRQEVVAFLENSDSPYRQFSQLDDHGRDRGGLYDEPTLGFEELLIKILRAQTGALDDYYKQPLPAHILKDSCARLFWSRQGSAWTPPDCYLNFAWWLRRWGQPGPQNAVVTFNWDLVVERSLGVGWSYTVTEPEIVSVLKPHGSINSNGHLRQNLRPEYPHWRRLSPESRLSFDGWNPFGNPDRDGIHPDLRCMIFPGDPHLPTQDADLRLIWSDVAKVMSTADTIVFIGYSLPEYDSYATDFFVTNTVGKGLEVYNPSTDDLSRYKKLFGSAVQLNRSTFEDCPYAKRPGKELIESSQL